METVWHSCVAFIKDGSKKNVIVRGAGIHLKGRIRTAKYTGSNGMERIAYEVVADRWEALE